MKRYLVIGIVDANVSVEVEAESPEEAYELGSKQLEPPGVCGQCSHEINVGELSELRVDDPETGETVYTDAATDPKLTRLIHAVRAFLALPSPRVQRAVPVLKELQAAVEDAER